MMQAHEVVNLGMSGLGTWADRILQHPMSPAGVRGERREERMEQWMEKGMEETMEDRMDCLHKLP